MLIRSQDKKFLTDDLKFEIVTNTYYPEFDDGEIKVESKIYASVGLTFATYSTEEKAIKVLDMIQEAYARCESVKALSSGIMFEVTERIRNQEKAEDFKNEHRATFVFQMPQDQDDCFKE